jgi:uncharacterized protein YndB with AHSA1/START domain
MGDLSQKLDRTIFIKARRETVFRYFTDSDRWAKWWGQGSTIDARAGGHVLIRYPGGVEVSGEVIELTAPERIVFTYGYASGKPFGPGASRVTIRLEAAPAGTRLHLVHEMAEADTRDQHVQGWRYQLAVFANVVTDEVNAGAARVVEAWWAAWSSTDAAARRALLEPLVSPDVRFADRFGLVTGVDELLTHIAAVHTFMPGTKLAPAGGVRHCQGVLLADWTATGPDARSSGAGTNVFVLDEGGRIVDVTGFWPAPPK